MAKPSETTVRMAVFAIFSVESFAAFEEYRVIHESNQGADLLKILATLLL